MINVDFDDNMRAGQVEAIVSEIEKEAHERWPQVRRLFIRPLQDAARQLEH
jgi:hypothetical protein